MRLTTAQALLRFLVAQHSVRDGQRTRLIAGLYGIFGHGNLAGLGQALAECDPGELPFLEARNEQSAVHAAAAFARASRRRSTFACTASIGPGALNMIPAVAGACINRLPVLVLPGDEYAERRQGTILQGLEHTRSGDTTVNDCFRPVARYYDRIQRPEQLLTALLAAMRILTTPDDPGPVVLCLPQDVQTEAFDFPLDFFAPRDWHIDRPVADARALDAAADVIRSARRPLLVAGGGVVYSEAEDELRAFARDLGVPVAETYAGKGTLAERSWRNLGGLGVEGTTAANTLARDADVVVLAGTRMSDFVSGSQSVFAHPDLRVVGLNIARADAGKLGGLAVVGDLRTTLVALAERVGHRVTSEAYEQEASALVAAWRQTLAPYSDGAQPMTQLEMVRVVNEAAPARSRVIAAAGTLPGDVLKAWDATGARSCELEFGFSCMGYEIPGGIGARLADPAREVVVLVGDGSFLLNPTELFAAAQHGVKITVVVSDNAGMRSIRRLEQAMVHRPFANLFEQRDPASRTPLGQRVEHDLAGVAAGLGVRARSVSGHGELRHALEEALGGSETTVIVVATDPDRYLDRSEVWRDVAPAEVSTDPALLESRAVYERDRAARQRRFV